jgi:hypothetical protein
MLAGVATAGLIAGYLVTGSAAPAADLAREAAPVQSQAPTDGDPGPAPAPLDPGSGATLPTPATPAPEPLTRTDLAARAEAPLVSLPRPTGPVSQAWSSSAGALSPINRGAPPPAPATTEAAPAFEPPPAPAEMAVPALQLADSFGAKAQAKRDSAAMTRILRAVSSPPGSGKASR